MLNVYVAVSDHVTRLREAYRAVGDRTWAASDFLEENLAASRELFTPESLNARLPRPRSLEVIALLSGLPFPDEFTDRLVAVQRQIGEVVGDRLHYWVAPRNLGVEYCVFKWPTETFDDTQLAKVRDALASVRQPSFRYRIGGIQVNPDGCVVARGFDEDAAIFSVRERMRTDVPFLPARQSGWAHVPLGRILEPLGTRRFSELQTLLRSLEDREVVSADIVTLALVHETRWYMEERTVLQEFTLTPR